MTYTIDGTAITCGPPTVDVKLNLIILPASLMYQRDSPAYSTSSMQHVVEYSTKGKKRLKRKSAVAYPSPQYPSRSPNSYTSTNPKKQEYQTSMTNDAVWRKSRTSTGAVVDVETWPVGSHVTLDCSPGTYPSGDLTITCQEDGTWLSPAGSCHSKILIIFSPLAEYISRAVCLILYVLARSHAFLILNSQVRPVIIEKLSLLTSIILVMYLIQKCDVASQR